MLSPYTVSVPIFVQLLTSLSAVLDKADAYAEEKKVDRDFLLNMRLYPDMYSVIRQVQQATSHAARISAALASIEPPKMQNNEKTFSDLKARIAETIDFLRGLKPKQFEGADDKPIKVGKHSAAGRVLLLTHAYPQFYFHCTTAYDILRHCGVPLVKADFLGTRADI